MNDFDQHFDDDQLEEAFSKKHFYERLKKNGHTCSVLHKLVDPIEFGFHFLPDKGRTKLMRFFAMLCIVDEKNLLATNFLRSQLALDGEKIRHIRSYLYVVHPFSKLLKYWENFMIVVYTISVLYLTFFFSFFQVGANLFYDSSLAVCTEILCFFDIIFNFNVGYFDKTKNEICLNRTNIVLRYLKGFFFVDFVAWIPFETIIYPLFPGKEDIIVVYDDLFCILKIRRVFILIKYIRHYMKRCGFSLTTSRAIIITVSIVIYLQWVNAFQFMIVYIKEGSYTPENPDPNTWMSILRVWKAEPINQYFCGLFRAVLLVTFQGLNMDAAQTMEDQIFSAIVWVSSMVLTTYCVSIIIFTINGENYAKTRYHSLLSQLNIYMDRKEVPHELRKKLLHYYRIRHSDCFISEKEILETITGGLLHDVIMHSCRRVINNVAFLKFLPDDMLIEVVSSLRIQIVLPNEVIIHVDTMADCIYFIVKGTVALYSSGGHEDVHLHDGDYFGETSLIGGPRMRKVNVIAISPCELLCLDAEHFTKAVARHPELLADMIRTAAENVEELYDNDEGNP